MFVERVRKWIHKNCIDKLQHDDCIGIYLYNQMVEEKNLLQKQLHYQDAFINSLQDQIAFLKDDRRIFMERLGLIRTEVKPNTNTTEFKPVHTKRGRNPTK